MSPSAALAVAVAPCAACSHAENHHLGCRLHDACCGADACGCLGYEPAATRAEIEYAAAWTGCDADELEAVVRDEERRARETM